MGVATAMRVAARGTSAEALPVHRRTALLSRLVAARPEVAAAVDGVKAVVMLVYGANRYAEEVTATALAAPPVRPDAPLSVVPSPEWPSTGRADAVVIGSGAGGAFAARTLARAGVEVVVVEEGRRWGVDELRSMHPLDRYSRLYRDAGTTVALGWPPVVLPIGRAVGGTTVVNSGTCYRPPGGVLQRWRDEFGLELADLDRLDPLFDDVEHTLSVAPAPLEVMGNNGRLALAGAAALGWEAAPIPRNAPGCCGCCQCALGCPRNAKFGVHLNALPQACDSGARILSEARVRRILHEDGHTTGVVVQRPDGSEIVIRTACVVVAAGAGETPMLLWRSGLGEHPELGRNMAIHPALSVTGRFAEPVVAWKGVLQSAAIHELHEQEGILVEATATPPGMGSMVLPGLGPELLAAVADSEHYAQLGAMIGDEGSGRVQSVRGHTVLRYDLSPSRRPPVAHRRGCHGSGAAGGRSPEAADRHPGSGAARPSRSWRRPSPVPTLGTCTSPRSTPRGPPAPDRIRSGARWTPEGGCVGCTGCGWRTPASCRAARRSTRRCRSWRCRWRSPGGSSSTASSAERRRATPSPDRHTTGRPQPHPCGPTPVSSAR